MPVMLLLLHPTLLRDLLLPLRLCLFLPESLVILVLLLLPEMLHFTLLFTLLLLPPFTALLYLFTWARPLLCGASWTTPKLRPQRWPSALRRRVSMPVMLLLLHSTLLRDLLLPLRLCLFLPESLVILMLLLLPEMLHFILLL